MTFLKRKRGWVIAFGVIVSLIGLGIVPARFSMRSSNGGGLPTFTPPRQVNADDIALPEVYRIEAIEEF